MKDIKRVEVNRELLRKTEKFFSDNRDSGTKEKVREAIKIREELIDEISKQFSKIGEQVSKKILEIECSVKSDVRKEKEIQELMIEYLKTGRDALADFFVDKLQNYIESNKNF